MTRFRKLATLFLVASVPWPARAADGLWLRLTTSVTSTTACNGGETETLIFFDGLLATRTEGRDGVLTVIRAEAPAKAVRELRRALASNNVADAQGDCGLDVVDPGEFFTTTINWIGGGATGTNTFTVNSDRAHLCPAAVNRIAAAVQRFVGMAVSNPIGREVTHLQLPADPPCDRIQ